MSYLGSWKINDYLTFPANTHNASTGAATDADSVPTYRLYEDETATPILTGSMALLDSTNTAGFYSERIQLTAANGFEKGKSYTLYITATVSSVAGTMSQTFQIEAEVDANIVSDKTDYALSTTPPTAAAIRSEIDTNSTQLAAIVADTAELQTDDVPGLIAALDTLIDAIKAKTDNLPASPAATSDIPTTAQINAEVDTALTDIHLDHLLAADYDPATKPGIATALLNELVENDAGVSRFTVNALENAPSGGSSLTLADFFDTDSGETAGTAVSGSVVGEMVASITAGGIPGSVEVTDILIDDDTNPIEGAAVWITTDEAGTNTIWAGTTNASGYPKDAANNNPFLDPGTYYVWVQLSGYSFSNPTTEVVS